MNDAKKLPEIVEDVLFDYGMGSVERIASSPDTVREIGTRIARRTISAAVQHLALYDSERFSDAATELEEYFEVSS